MFDKLKARFEDYLLKKGLAKFTTGAVAGIMGLLGSAAFTAKVQPILTQAGITIDQAQLQQGLTVAITGAAMWAYNFVKFHFAKAAPPQA